MSRQYEDAESAELLNEGGIEKVWFNYEVQIRWRGKKCRQSHSLIYHHQNRANQGRKR